MIKLYKFYKPNCAPCYEMERYMNQLDVPEEYQLIPLNVENQENKKFAQDLGIRVVPALYNEDKNIILEGRHTKNEIKEFLQKGVE